MIIHRTVAAGKPGTKRMREKFGEALVCVRYRYDTDAKWMVKTVELRIEERPWEPKGGRMPVNKRVAVRVEYEESRLRGLVKSVGGEMGQGEEMLDDAVRRGVGVGAGKQVDTAVINCPQMG